MATDATGAPTANYGWPKFNTSVDAPSGLGSNAQMDAIDTTVKTVDNKAIAAQSAVASKASLALIVALGGV